MPPASEHSVPDTNLVRLTRPGFHFAAYLRNRFNSVVNSNLG